MGVVLPEPRFLQGLRDVCTRYRILLIFDEVITGFRVGTGRRAGLERRRSRSDVPRQNHRRRLAGRRVWRPRGSDAARRAVGTGLSGGHAVGQPAGDDRRTCGASSGCRRVSTDSSTELGAQLAEGLADAARRAGVALQVNGIGSALTPFFTSTPVTELSDSASRRCREVRRVLQGDARARRLPAAVTVRSVVPVGRAHRARRRQDHQGRARSDEGGRCRELTIGRWADRQTSLRTRTIPTRPRVY